MNYLLRFSAALLLLIMTGTARSQSALDGFDPNANGVVVYAVRQPDGKIFISGSFTSVQGVTRNRIARLNVDGTLDSAFDPNPSDYVSAIAVQPDGKVLVGGNFTSIGGQPRNRIARLDPVTGLADSFNPDSSQAVRAIAVQADGKILVGGDFVRIGGQSRFCMARLNSATGLADSFNPNPNNSVDKILLQPDGKILVSGVFQPFFGGNSIGGQPRNRMARLDPVTGLADSFNPNPNNTVNTMALQADGKVLVGGDFFTIGGQTRNRIARLDPTSGLADSFNPDANWSVNSIVVQADGKIVVGGLFNSSGGQNSIGGQPRNRIARLDPATGLADSFNPNANNFVYTVVLQADGKVVAGGEFASLAPNGGMPVARNYIARLETDGRVDQTLNLSAVGVHVLATSVQPDGKILIGGQFSNVLGVPRNNIARLNTDGTLDTAFNPNANDEVEAIAVQADGKVLVVGNFTGIGGQTRNHLARLDATSGLADSFDPNPDAWVLAIAVQADSKILLGGDFSTVGGQPRNRIARLDATTGLADSFNSNGNDTVASVAVQADGKILAGGLFTTIGGQSRNRIARLNASTGLADSFDPNGSGFVQSIAVQADGKVLAGGSFMNIGGQARFGIARLDAATGAPDSFNPVANGSVVSIAVQADGKIFASGGFLNIGGQARTGIARLDAITGLADSFDPGANSGADSMAVQGDGKILVGGGFSSVGGQPRGLFARLTNGTPGLQELIATQSAVTWTRGGSSPRFTRVAFESSMDNVNYAPLGPGTAAGSNWILTGLNLPSGQNFYVRARGYYRSGYFNASESIAELVRQVFLVPPAITSVNNATFTIGFAGTFTVITTGIPTGSAMSITENGVLPAGVTFVNNNNGTATLAGTPGSGTSGNYPITITAANGVSPNAIQNFVLNVSQPQAPAITSANNATFKVGVAGTFTVTTTGFPTGAGMSIAQTGSLPAGVTFFDNQDGTATLAGTPTAGGIYSITITASNGVSPNASQNFLLTVNRPPAITSSGSTTFTANISREFTVLTVGFPTGANMVITQTGALPTGVTFTNNNDGTATLGGTAGSGAVGTYPLVITANNGVAPNATQNFTLTVVTSTSTPTPSPTPTPTATPTATPTVSPTPPPTATPGSLGNISTRLRVLSGDNALIGGMIATGTVNKKVIIRAIGPTLSDFGVPGALQDPTLELYQGSTLITSNDDWRQSPQQVEIQNSGLAPNKDTESAIIATLTPNQGYTAIVRGKNGTTGVGVVEAFDLDQGVASKLGNISTRGFVDVDDNVMIAGLIVSPSNGTGTKVLVRAIGPTLGDFGVPNALANPTLELVNSSGTTIRSNDNWKDDPQQRAEIEAANLAPSHDEEAALVETVAPGAYTAVVRGSNRTTGIGLVEVYNIQ